MYSLRPLPFLNLFLFLWHEGPDRIGRKVSFKKWFLYTNQSYVAGSERDKDVIYKCINKNLRVTKIYLFDLDEQLLLIWLSVWHSEEIGSL